jgi:hypothetical protein
MKKKTPPSDRPSQPRLRRSTEFLLSLQIVNA